MKTWRWMVVMASIGALAAACTVETTSDDDDSSSGNTGGAGGGTTISSSSSGNVASTTGTGGSGGGGNFDVPDGVQPAYDFTVTQNGADLDVSGRAFFFLTTNSGGGAALLCQEQWNFTAKMTQPVAAECPGGDCTGLCPGEAGAQMPGAECVGSFTGMTPDVASYATDCNYENAEAWMHPNNTNSVGLLENFLHSAPMEADLFIAGDSANGSWGAFADDSKMGDQAGWFNGMSVTYAVKQNGMWDIAGADLFGVTLQEMAPTDNTGIGNHVMSPAFLFNFQ